MRAIPAFSGMSEQLQRDLYTTFGLVMVGWSWVEMFVNQWINAVHHNGGRAIQDKIPKGYDRKVDYLRGCFDTIPALAPLAAQGKAMLDRTLPLAEARDWIAHGTLHGYKPKEGTPLIFWRMDITAGGVYHKVSERTFSLLRLLTVGQQAIDLSGEMGKFAHCIIDAFEPKNAAHDRCRRHGGSGGGTLPVV